MEHIRLLDYEGSFSSCITFEKPEVYYGDKSADDEREEARPEEKSRALHDHNDDLEYFGRVARESALNSKRVATNCFSIQ